MFNLMKEHHKKLNDLINLRPRSRENRGKRFEVIVHAGNIYIKLYNIYRCKYYKKKKDNLSAKIKKKFDYKHSKISGDSRYLSDTEQEEQEQQEEQKKNKMKNHLIQMNLLNG